MLALAILNCKYTVLVKVSACTRFLGALPWANRIKIIKYIDWEDVEEPCKGDTPA